MHNDNYKKAVRGIDGLETIRYTAEKLISVIDVLSRFDEMPSRKAIGSDTALRLKRIVNELLTYVDDKLHETAAILGVNADSE